MDQNSYPLVEITSELNAIWRQFSIAGITDDLTIIEHLAYLFLIDNKGLWDEIDDAISHNYSSKKPFKSFDYKLRDNFPSKFLDLIPAPPEIRIDRLREILSIVEKLSHEIPLNTLFNKYIIPKLPRMLAGGRYPTARHIAYTMSSLVEINEGEILGDLACGSGGMLVAETDFSPQVVGVEISTNWARIAFTNVILHQLSDPDIRIGNTLEIFALGSDTPKFDCILTNPPFGEVVDKYLIDNAFGGQVTGRSETLLTAKALEALKPGGRMAVLMPSGFLFADSGGEFDLKSNIMEIYHPQAVISLPKDTFQPYSTIPTNILLIHNFVTTNDYPVENLWFYRVLHDGFSSGRNRQPEPEQNELPRLESAVKTQKKEADEVFIYGLNRFEIKQIILEGKEIAGFSFFRVGEKDLSLDLSYLQSASGNGEQGLLAYIKNSKTLGQIYISGKRIFHSFNDTETLDLSMPSTLEIENTYNISDDELGNISLTFQGTEGYIKDIPFRISKEPQSSEPVGIVVDNAGNPLTGYLFFESLDWMKKKPRPSALELLNEEEQLA